MMGSSLQGVAFVSAQVRGCLLLVSIDLAGRVQYQLGPFRLSGLKVYRL